MNQADAAQNQEQKTKTERVRPRRSLKTMMIEPFKQVKMGIYVMGLSLLFLFIAGYLFFEAFNEQYQHVMSIFNVVDPNLKWELVTNDVFYSNGIKLGVLFLVYISGLFMIVFRMTHKIYGPLISVERFIEQLKNGQYRRRVNIRKGDHLTRLVEKLNTLAEYLEKKYPNDVVDPYPKRRREDQN